MTVCVAAIFEREGVVVASDRMLSAGDIDFEPDVTKFRYLTTSCGVMLAGDINFQTDILAAVEPKINEQISQQPSEWIKIRDIATIYKQETDRAISGLAEDRILSPLGLSRQTFLSGQKDFSPDFVVQLTQELLNFAGPSAETIVMGLDVLGPHIFVVTNDGMQCCDIAGFAAIGSGRSHAESQMMLFGHTYRHSFADALLSVYFAKKRSEIAPGVGSATDMFFAGVLGGITMVGDHVISELEKRYREEKRYQQKNANRSRAKIGSFVQALLRSPASVQEQRELPAITDADTSSAEQNNQAVGAS